MINLNECTLKEVSDEANRGMGKVGWFVILFLIFLLAASIYFV